jgi:phage shock protein PspC (stress-responsive transcriptional regulator)
MNASDTGQEAEDQVTPQMTDQVHQDQQPAGQPTGGESYQPRHDYAIGDQPLYRPTSGRMIAGVAAGIAQYLGVDVAVVRIVLAVLAFVGGAGVPIYIAGWLLIPDEGASQSIASELIGSLQGRSR